MSWYSNGMGIPMIPPAGGSSLIKELLASLCARAQLLGNSCENIAGTTTIMQQLENCQ